MFLDPRSHCTKILAADILKTCDLEIARETLRSLKVELLPETSSKQWGEEGYDEDKEEKDEEEQGD